MNKDTTYVTIHFPIRTEVYSLKDGLFIAGSDSDIQQIYDQEFINALELEATINEDELHEKLKHNIVAYVRRELLPKEDPNSPIHTPNSWIEVFAEGDITTWQKEPYHKPYLVN